MSALVRHQVGSLAATAADFAVMIACVSVLGLGPATGTVLGAASGGVTNFVLGRRWIFRTTRGTASGQALRYALVSFASLLFNAAGEYVLASVAHFPYVGARIVVAFFVSVVWNFPMQKGFVFRAVTP